MNYKRDLESIKKLTVSKWSPREAGEVEARSPWKEVSIDNLEYAGRITTVKAMAEKHERVWLKTATLGGHARLFVYVS